MSSVDEYNIDYFMKYSFYSPKRMILTLLGFAPIFLITNLFSPTILLISAIVYSLFNFIVNKKEAFPIATIILVITIFHIISHEQQDISSPVLFGTSGYLIISFILKEIQIKRGLDRTIKKEYSYLSRSIDEVISFSNIAVVKRDLSELYAEFDILRAAGVDDIVKYLEDNQDMYEILASKIHIVEVNEATYDLYESYNKTELFKTIQRSAFKNRKTMANSMNKMFLYSDTQVGERILYTKTKKVKDILVKSIYPKSGESIMSTYLIEITDIDTLANKYKEFETRYGQIFKEAPIGLVLYKDLIIQNVNEKYTQIHGYKKNELIGKNLYKLIPKKHHGIIQKIRKDRLEGIDPDSYEIEGLRKDGSVFSINVHGTIVDIDNEPHTLSFVQDISKTKKYEREVRSLQEQMILNHKLESLGLLAGGISHDFNNILQVLRSGIDLLSFSKNISLDDKDLIEDLLITINNASALINDLLLYTGKYKADTRYSSVNRLFEELKRILKLTISNRYIIEYEIKIPQNCVIRTDKSQFIQMLQNLVINSSDGMLNPGKIIISARVRDMELEPVMEDTNTKLIQYPTNTIINAPLLELSVKDEGKGIASDKLTKIFDPFYSEKEGGKGLGLSVVQGIVRLLDGFIKINSVEGKGTKISIYLPFEKSDSELVDTKDNNNFELQSSFSDYKVLLIDDDDKIRKYMAKKLSSWDLEVTTAENGMDALEKFDESFDLVILDLIMPVMDGLSTFKELIKLNSKIPIVVYSGYSNDSIEDFPEHDKLTFLQKPINFQELNAIISKYYQK